MVTKEAKEYYDKFNTFSAEPITDNPLLSEIEPSTLIAWFRCNSCTTCKFREEVIEKDADHDIKWCSRTHEKFNIIDMVSYLGYEKEGRKNDVTPQFKPID